MEENLNGELIKPKLFIWIVSLVLIVFLFIVVLFLYYLQKNQVTEVQNQVSNIENQINTLLGRMEELNDVDSINEGEEVQTGEPIVFSTNNDPSLHISKAVEPFDYTVDDLLASAGECNNVSEGHDREYFENLVNRFTGTEKIVYYFKYSENKGGEMEQPDTFVVTLLPNVLEYSSLDMFENDFTYCYPGGDAYPYKFNDNWLMFVNNCGFGSTGCREAETIVKPSLEFSAR